MTRQLSRTRLTARLVDQLYVEAMVLADEVRSYFDGRGREERDLLPPARRVAFSCEALKVTTRLMHVIAWLLTRRAVEAGEISEREGRAPSRRLGHSADSEPCATAQLPEAARALVEASRDLYRRVERLDRENDRSAKAAGPARGLQRLLERAF